MTMVELKAKKMYKTKKKKDVCCNPNLWLATKARAYKGVGQK
jgi:hypothetical protein